MSISLKSPEKTIKAILNDRGLDIGNTFNALELFKFVKQDFKKKVNFNEILFNKTSKEIIEIMEGYFGPYNIRAKYILEGISAFLEPSSISIKWIEDNLDKIQKKFGKDFILKYKLEFNLEKDEKKVEELILLKFLTDLTFSYASNDSDCLPFLVNWKKKYLKEGYTKLMFRDNVNVKEIKRFEDVLSTNYFSESIQKLILENSIKEYKAWVDKQINKHNKEIESIKEKDQTKFGKNFSIERRESKIAKLSRSRHVYAKIIMEAICK